LNFIVAENLFMRLYFLEKKFLREGFAGEEEVVNVSFAWGISDS